MIMNNERIKLGEWFFGDRLRSEKDPVKSQALVSPSAVSQALKTSKSMGLSVPL